MCHSWIPATCWVDLTHARMRMQDHGRGLHLGEGLWRNDERVLYPLVVCHAAEAFLIKPGHIQDVGLLQDARGERVVQRGTGVTARRGHDLLWHAQRRGRDEAQGDLEAAQQLRQRVYGGPVLQIAHHRDDPAAERRRQGHLGRGRIGGADPRELVQDRVEVQERLRRMLARAVARVEQRFIHRRGGHRSGASPRMKKHQGVAGTLRGTRGVFERLALGRSGAGRVHRENGTPQPEHGRLERAAGARGRLVEDAREHPALERLVATLLLDQLAHARCRLQYLGDLRR
mmetsp:Transcript_32850/g.87862  ORF Transcript_32850/g.87862 Transcript_32850/m.87862 type:complete len:287 (+) Transcript_32850:443-1303(+)